MPSEPTPPTLLELLDRIAQGYVNLCELDIIPEQYKSAAMEYVPLVRSAATRLREALDRKPPLASALQWEHDYWHGGNAVATDINNGGPPPATAEPRACKRCKTPVQFTGSLCEHGLCTSCVAIDPCRPAPPATRGATAPTGCACDSPSPFLHDKACPAAAQEPAACPTCKRPFDDAHEGCENCQTWVCFECTDDACSLPKGKRDADGVPLCPDCYADLVSESAATPPTPVPGERAPEAWHLCRHDSCAECSAPVPGPGSGAGAKRYGCLGPRCDGTGDPTGCTAHYCFSGRVQPNPGSGPTCQVCGRSDGCIMPAQCAAGGTANCKPTCGKDLGVGVGVVFCTPECRKAKKSLHPLPAPNPGSGMEPWRHDVPSDLEPAPGTATCASWCMVPWCGVQGKRAPAQVPYVPDGHGKNYCSQACYAGRPPSPSTPERKPAP